MVDVASILYSGLASATPLLLASLGEAVLERSGRVNLGVEGMMALGAASGVLGGIYSGSPYIGLVVGGLAGMMLAMLYVAGAILLGADQIVVGLVIFFAGTALSDVVGSLTHGSPGPSITGAPMDPVAFSALLAVVLAWILLGRTWVGVEIRAMGESEEYARSRGLRVDMIRSILALAAGFAAGIAGAYISIALHNGRWYSGITAGWGWIALGIVILGYWSPPGVAIASAMTGTLLASRTLLAALGLNEAIADMTPYLAVLLALGVVSRLAERVGAKPPSLVWRRE